MSMKALIISKMNAQSKKIMDRIRLVRVLVTKIAGNLV